MAQIDPFGSTRGIINSSDLNCSGQFSRFAGTRQASQEEFSSRLSMLYTQALILLRL